MLLWVWRIGGECDLTWVHVLRDSGLSGLELGNLLCLQRSEVGSHLLLLLSIGLDIWAKVRSLVWLRHLK